MTTPTSDVLSRVSADGKTTFMTLRTTADMPYPAAETFLSAFYPALQSSRSTISAFYVPPTPTADGKLFPSITFNGNIIPTSAAFQSLFEKQTPDARYEVQSYDCHPLNVNYPVVTPTGNAAASGRNMSILLCTTGFVRYGDGREGAMRGFSESFVLVPNEEGKAKRKGKRREWLIQSQNFRITV